LEDSAGSTTDKQKKEEIVDVLLQPEETGDEAQGPVDEATRISLGSSDELSVALANDILKSRYCTVVVVGGEHLCGKTTFVSGLYQSFAFGGLGEFEFAGSETLYGFEFRCHKARLISNEPAIGSTRTRGLDARFLHIEVESRPKGRSNILLSDISGEMFEAIRASGEYCASLDVMRRADHFIYLVDGAAIANRYTRASVRDHATTAFRRLLTAGVLERGTPVRVIFNKSDVLRDADEEAASLVLRIKTELAQILGPHFDLKFIDLNSHCLFDRDERSIEAIEFLKEWTTYTKAQSWPALSLQQLHFSGHSIDMLGVS
jgi:hypothetical protein